MVMRCVPARVRATGSASAGRSHRSAAILLRWRKPRCRKRGDTAAAVGPDRVSATAMYSHILVPIDGSPTSQRGLDEAIELGRALGSNVHVLNVVDAALLIANTSMYAPPEQLLEDLRVSGERLAFEAAARVRHEGLRADAAVRCDPGLRVADSILLAAQQCHADLIVMGTHGRRGVERLTLGSDAEGVLRGSAVPVLLVRMPAAA